MQWPVKDTDECWLYKAWKITPNGTPGYPHLKHPKVYPNIGPRCWQMADFQVLHISSELDFSGHNRSESMA